MSEKSKTDWSKVDEILKRGKEGDKKEKGSEGEVGGGDDVNSMIDRIRQRAEEGTKIINQQEYERVKREMAEWRKKYPTNKSAEALQEEDRELKRRFEIE